MNSNTDQLSESQLTLREAARYLGLREDTVRRLANLSHIPHVRIPHCSTPEGARLFEKRDLDAHRAKSIAYHEARLASLRQNSENGAAA